MASKTCSSCRVEKDLEEFPLCPGRTVGGRHTYCKLCKARKAREYRAKDLEAFAQTQRAWRRGNPKKVMVTEARKRAKKAGVPCTITADDFEIPEFCPAIGIKLVTGTGSPEAGSASLDKIIPELGYVPGNVIVISYKANTMKNDATPAELLAFADWVYKAFGGESDA